jgi:iron complex outermembrane receptor protein
MTGQNAKSSIADKTIASAVMRRRTARGVATECAAAAITAWVSKICTVMLPCGIATLLVAGTIHCFCTIRCARDLCYGTRVCAAKDNVPATHVNHGVRCNRSAYEFAVQQPSGAQTKGAKVKNWTPWLWVGVCVFGAQSHAAEPDTRTGNESAKDTEFLTALEEFVVTGSHIRGGVAPASSIILIDKEEIRRSGYASVRELINSLPQNYAGGMSENTSILPTIDAGRNVGATTTVDLRGLGAGSTLTLLNGHRLAPNGEGYAVDVSSIPLSAISRIEILTDGASAVYGSDAVGGVVNIILDDTFDRAETQVQYGGVTSGHMTESRVSQTFGERWGSGKVLGTFEYYRRDPLLARDPGFASAVPPWFDLTADQHRSSAVLHVDQKLAAATTGYADVLASYQTKILNTVFNTIQHDKQRTLSVDTGVNRQLPGDWLVELSGQYGRQTDDQAALPLPPQMETGASYKNDIWAADLKLDGPLISLPGGTLKAALGLGFRRESIASQGGGIDSASRNARSVYLEMSVPLVGASNAIPAVKHLDLTLAGRAERYSDFGVTANPKVGLVWVPNDNLQLRGTWGTSFKAPALLDKYGTIRAVIFDLPDSTGTTRSVVSVGANRDLGPEKAHTWTLGADYRPSFVPDLTVSTTYFDTVYRNRVTTVDPDLFNILPNQAIYPTAVIRNPPLAFVNSLLASATEVISLVGPFDPSEIAAVVRDVPLNVALYRTNGMDMLLRFNKLTRAGQFIGSLNATYYLKADQQVTTESAAVTRLDRLFYLPSFRYRLSSAWARGSWSLAASVNYTKRYINDSVAPAEVIDAYTTVDALVSFAPASLWDGSFRVSLSAINVLDQRPPQVNTPLFPNGVQFGFDAANANPIGRFLTLQLSKRW